MDQLDSWGENYQKSRDDTATLKEENWADKHLYYIIYIILLYILYYIILYYTLLSVYGFGCICTIEEGLN